MIELSNICSTAATGNNILMSVPLSHPTLVPLSQSHSIPLNPSSANLRSRRQTQSSACLQLPRLAQSGTRDSTARKQGRVVTINSQIQVGKTVPENALTLPPVNNVIASEDCAYRQPHDTTELRACMKTTSGRQHTPKSLLHLPGYFKTSKKVILIESCDPADRIVKLRQKSLQTKQTANSSWVGKQTNST